LRSGPCCSGSWRTFRRVPLSSFAEPSLSFSVIPCLDRLLKRFPFTLAAESPPCGECTFIAAFPLSGFLHLLLFRLIRSTSCFFPNVSILPCFLFRASYRLDFSSRPILRPPAISFSRRSEFLLVSLLFPCSRGDPLQGWHSPYVSQ